MNTVIVKPSGEFVEAELEITDDQNNPAPIDGTPEWSLSDESVVTMEIDPSGMNAKFTPKGPAGTTSVQVKCDADTGSGVKEIIGTGQIEVTSGEAVHVNIVFGAPQPIPPV